MTLNHRHVAKSTTVFRDTVIDRVEHGARFCALVATPRGDATALLAITEASGAYVIDEVTVPGDVNEYESLSAHIPSAGWYEREIHDLFGLVPAGHPQLESLVFPFAAHDGRPRPGSGTSYVPLEPDRTPLSSFVAGEGLFTIPLGPVRSGVFESVEYLVETPGEGIHHIQTRVFYKHRGVETRFVGMDLFDGVLLAERCEGVASAAHAFAYCSAIERLADADVPTRAALVRVLHAELERVANHLESTVRHCEAAGQAVAFARFATHKERVQQLRSRLCGSRFSRGVIVPGGVTRPLPVDYEEIRSTLDVLARATESDLRLLLATPSFVDRLRGTGRLRPDIAAPHGALGPVGRASGVANDARIIHPYGAYPELSHVESRAEVEGDALARQRVRVQEIRASFDLIDQCLDLLGQLTHDESSQWRVDVGRPTGRTIGWVEAPQGELLYLIELTEGRLQRVKPRSASFHNLPLFAASFTGDILTDFAFIEASFGLSIAGAAS